MHDYIEIHPGVIRTRAGRAAVYRGAGDALIAAGIVQQHQLPGRPGNPKTACTITPEGARAGRGTGLYCRDVAGKKRIYAERDGGFTVYLNLSADRVDALEAERVRAAACWPFPQVFGVSFQRPAAGVHP